MDRNLVYEWQRMQHHHVQRHVPDKNAVPDYASLFDMTLVLPIGATQPPCGYAEQLWRRSVARFTQVRRLRTERTDHRRRRCRVTPLPRATGSPKHQGHDSGIRDGGDPTRGLCLTDPDNRRE
jgi:hypothetical protein